MRRSREVPLTLLAALALTTIGTTIGCHDEPEGPRSCVDKENHLVPAANCEAHGGSGVVIPFHYVYGGSSGGHYGDMVVGASETGVSRGGFGHSGEGGEGGEGGGE
ncbi:hypothetical protein [Acidicapsa ligni]|uniref:hypothetical protein n=1 Tax=Acidicapsa ligni TaxID=542300 RepID=UPI0021E01E78|nr:hypothetical protein [Acidicapsa ligni]